MRMEKYELAKEDLPKLTKDLNLKDIRVIFLDGVVGSGKTTLVKDIALGLSVSSEVTSPTFSFVNEYEDKIFHYDMYNISIEKFINIGLLDNLEKDGIHIFEWGDDLLKGMVRNFGFGILNIEIKITKNENKRIYRLIYG